MKKLLGILLLGAVILVAFGKAGFCDSTVTLYSATLSTYSVVADTYNAQAPLVNLPIVKIKSFVIFQTSTTAQVVSIWKNVVAGSTATVVKVCDISVPGTVGWYYPFGTGVIPYAVVGERDSINIPYFYAKTDSATVPVKILIGYVKQ